MPIFVQLEILSNKYIFDKKRVQKADQAQDHLSLHSYLFEIFFGFSSQFHCNHFFLVLPLQFTPYSIQIMLQLVTLLDLNTNNIHKTDNSINHLLYKINNPLSCSCKFHSCQYTNYIPSTLFLFSHILSRKSTPPLPSSSPFPHTLLISQASESLPKETPCCPLLFLFFSSYFLQKKAEKPMFTGWKGLTKKRTNENCCDTTYVFQDGSRTGTGFSVCCKRLEMGVFEGLGRWGEGKEEDLGERISKVL